ncbi:hypothetical protein V2J09_009596 [Rumex salicifolius]
MERSMLDRGIYQISSSNLIYFHYISVLPSPESVSITSSTPLHFHCGALGGNCLVLTLPTPTSSISFSNLILTTSVFGNVDLRLRPCPRHLHLRYSLFKAIFQIHCLRFSSTASVTTTTTDRKLPPKLQVLGPLYRTLEKRMPRITENDEFDVDLEDIMVMEVVWLSIQFMRCNDGFTRVMLRQFMMRDDNFCTCDDSLGCVVITYVLIVIF